ncbi:MAG: ABC transporter ATP-binding protein [Candidatus Cybelea sp.]
MSLSTHALVACYPRHARPALDCVSLEVSRGTTLAIVGPSGAGKTTLLRVIAGLLRPSSGDVCMDGTSIAALAPQERRAALVFQDDALFDNMTVRENLRFALRRNGGPPEVRVTELASALHVAERLERRPRQLSGGERQRASIARALLSEPSVLLLDEPLAHLDPSLRRSVRDEIIGVRQRFAGPVLYVTHDHVDAMSVGDRLAVLIDGRLEDIGEPQRVYDAPRTLAVARFLGERPMNFFDDESALVGIRPERVRVCAEGGFPGRVMRRETTGADVYLDVQTDRGTIVVRAPAANNARPGELVTLDLPAQWLRRFNPETGAALG